MNFLLSDEQLQLQDALVRVLENSCDSPRLHASIDSSDGFDADLWQQLVDFGVTAICLPEEHGGLGLEMIDLALVAEVLGRFAAPVPFLGHVLASIAISLAGDEAQKRTWLPRLASGEILGSIALQEPVEQDRSGAWLPHQWLVGPGETLSGEKQYVPNLKEADLLIVGTEGGGLSLVDLREARPQTTRMGGIDLTRRLDAARFEGLRARPLPGGPDAAARLCDAAMILIAADSFGGATRCVDMAVSYANQREQFGVTIASFQALRHQLVNMALDAEPCRGLYWYAAHAFDHLPGEASHAAALAKAHVCEKFLEVARGTIEVHGGVGYTWEYDPHIWLKRAMFNWAWLGAPQLHRERAAALAGW